MFPPPHLLLSLLVVLRLSLCMQTTAFDVRKENSPVMEVQCIEKERQALLNLKKGLLDPSHRLSSWVEEVNCCQWRGVKCNNKTGHVVTLDLQNPYVMDNVDFIDADDTATLGGLHSLNLSRNNLAGAIPGNIGNLMSSLESLDFSRNHLFGVLPVSMANLNFLGTLDLSFNNFSGRIPQSTQLQSFNAASYMENSGLCGPPLSANCATNDISSQGHDHHSTGNEDGIDIPWFYIGMSMGYIVGFWIACGILLFNRSWRKACFRYVEKVHDWFYVILIVNARKLQRKFGN